MPLAGKHALITGGSRGIGRGIALKLAEQGVNVAVHYYQNQAAANDTLAQERERGADGCTVQFGALDIFVSNARPELPAFYSPPLDITLEQWDMAMNSQAKAFLVGVRESLRLMPDGGRVIAVTYSPGGRTGSWQPWVAMGSSKAALESLVRYFAVALAKRGITVNAVSPGLTEDSVVNSLPSAVQDMCRRWHESGWTPMGRMGTPADIGDFVTLLCMEEASFLTGQTIHVDGGASLSDIGVPLELQRG
jgi:enoyl-[acyl-carrier protein] reductase III